MTEAPKQIWASPSDSDGWHAPYAGNYECESSTQYIRADLVAELAQAALDVRPYVENAAEGDYPYPDSALENLNVLDGAIAKLQEPGR